MKIRYLTVAALVVALFVPAVMWAQTRGAGMGIGALGMGMGGGGVLRFADKLGLSTAQVTQIKAIIAAAQTANAPTREQLKANQQAFQASYNPAQFDANAVNGYIAQQTPLLQQLGVSGFQTEAKVLAVLTPSQFTELKQLRAEFKEWMQSRPGKP